MAGVLFGGRFLVQPQAASLIDDSGMVNSNAGNGKIVGYIGIGQGGEPHKALRFTDPARAKGVFQGGELLEAINGGFAPSPQIPGAGTIVAVQVAPLTQATSTLKDSVPADCMILKSTVFGLIGNQVKNKVEAGTSVGKKISIGYGTEVYVGDNLAGDLLQVTYTGANPTATMVVTQAKLTITGAAGETFEAEFSSYQNVQALYDLLASKSYLTVTLLANNPLQKTLNMVDNLTSADIKGAAKKVTANLQACIDWVNSGAQPYVTATRAANAGGEPAVAGTWIYLAGGTAPTPTNDDWQAAFNALKLADVQYIVPVSGDAGIHAMAETHCQYMSTRGKERRAIVGGLAGERTVVGDVSAILTRAKNLNSDRAQLVFCGVKDYDADGNLVTLPPYMTAARVAGMWAGTEYGEPLTHKYVRAQGLEYDLLPEELDELVQGGVCAIENVPGKGYRVVKSITTWLANNNYNRVEFSTGDVLDYVTRDVREAIEEAVIGTRNGPTVLAMAMSIADTRLRIHAKANRIVGDAANPAFKNLSAQVDGDVLRVQFAASAAIPCNYALIAVHAQVYRSAGA